mgnify:FL=1
MSLGWILLVGYLSISTLAMVLLYAACVSAKRADSIMRPSRYDRQAGGNAQEGYGAKASPAAGDAQPMTLAGGAKAWRAGT